MAGTRSLDAADTGCRNEQNLHVWVTVWPLAYRPFTGPAADPLLPAVNLTDAWKPPPRCPVSGRWVAPRRTRFRASVMRSCTVDRHIRRHCATAPLPGLPWSTQTAGLRPIRV
jgi:hypothetical protein